MRNGCEDSLRVVLITKYSLFFQQKYRLIAPTIGLTASCGHALRFVAIFKIVLSSLILFHLLYLLFIEILFEQILWFEKKIRELNGVIKLDSLLDTKKFKNFLNFQKTFARLLLITNQMTLLLSERPTETV